MVKEVLDWLIYVFKILLMYIGKSSRLKILFLYVLIKLLVIIVENINVVLIVLVLI